MCVHAGVVSSWGKKRRMDGREGKRLGHVEEQKRWKRKGTDQIKVKVKADI